nr:hypothetical protein Q903MT_gene1737 [Picea sitchensis]
MGPLSNKKQAPVACIGLIEGINTDAAHFQSKLFDSNGRSSFLKKRDRKEWGGRGILSRKGLRIH